MKKIVFHLGNCNTCQRILKQLKPDKKGFTFREIKSERISPAELECMKNLAGSYEAVFSRQSRSFKKFTPAQKSSLTESKMRDLILEDYTFLKRPVIIYGDVLFAGNSPKLIAEAEKTIK